MKTSRVLLECFYELEMWLPHGMGGGHSSLTLYMEMSAIKVHLDFCTIDFCPTKFLPQN